MRTTSLIRTFTLSIAIAALSLAACGGPRVYTLRGTQRDPGSDARIQVEQFDGGNYFFTLTATNVTPPDRIGDGNTVYLVWVRGENGQSQMVSRLAYDVDQRTGTARVTTPLRSFTILVTAESDIEVSSPSDNVVLQQEVSL